MSFFIDFLQKRVQNYSTIAQKINANFLCDEGEEWNNIEFYDHYFHINNPLCYIENPLMESGDEQAVSSEIERDLAEVRFMLLF